MKTDKRNAIIVGVLFLIALILNIIASAIMDPISSIPNYLVKIYPNKNTIIIGNLLNFICALAMILIPFFLFPIAKKINKNLAFAYIIFRFLEGILQISIVTKLLNLINLSMDFLYMESKYKPILQCIGNSIQSEIQWTEVIYVIIYICGALVFYSLLYISKIVPRFLSIWGLLAVILLLIGDILGMFNIGIFNTMPLMKGMIYFAPPIALNELVLSIWLIKKGFNFSSIATEN